MEKKDVVMNPRKRMVFPRSSALLIAGALALLISIPAPSQTEAGWIDLEYASADMATLTIPPVATPQCRTKNGDAVITWGPPAGGLPNGTRYWVTLDNDPPRDTQVSVFPAGAAHTYVGKNNLHPNGTNLMVRVFVVVPDSTTQPTKVLWEGAPATLKITFSRGDYRCR